MSVCTTASTSKGRKDLNEVRAVQATVNLLDPANAGVIGVDIGW